MVFVLSQVRGAHGSDLFPRSGCERKRACLFGKASGYGNLVRPVSLLLLLLLLLLLFSRLVLSVQGRSKRQCSQSQNRHHHLCFHCFVSFTRSSRVLHYL